jgi:hypothetical protein
MIFVPWKKGPAWYLKFSHVLVYSLLLTNYLIIPLGNLGLAMFFIFDPYYDLKMQSVQSWVVFFNVVCVSRVFEFFTTVRKTVLEDAHNYIAAQKLLKGNTGGEEVSEAPADVADETQEQKVSQIDLMKKAIVVEETMEKAAYLTRNRGYGEGEVRINTFIELNQDIYSLGFATQLNDDIMTQYFDVLTGELQNLGGHDTSSDSDSDSGDENKSKKMS